MFKAVIRSKWLQIAGGVLGVLVLSFAALSVGKAYLLQAGSASPQVTFIYSVKFVCSADGAQISVRAVPGVYRTSVNVHNFLEQTVSFTKKFLSIKSQIPDPIAGGVGTPTSSAKEPEESVTPKLPETLDADRGRLIDCQDIFRTLEEQGQPPISFVDPSLAPIEGFVVLESPVELDVVAVYTNFISEREREREKDKNVQPGVPVRNLELWNKIIFILKAPPPGTRVEQPGLPPFGKPAEVVVPSPVPGQAQDLEQLVRTTLGVPDEIEIVIIDVEFGVGKGLGNSGSGVGVGIGIGIGLAAGISIDVEYIQPKKVER